MVVDVPGGMSEPPGRNHVTKIATFLTCSAGSAVGSVAMTGVCEDRARVFAGVH
jgi:hypothetical protein